MRAAENLSIGHDLDRDQVEFRELGRKSAINRDEFRVRLPGAYAARSARNVQASVLSTAFYLYISQAVFTLPLP
jgi:hypothetical protein